MMRGILYKVMEKNSVIVEVHPNILKFEVSRGIRRVGLSARAEQKMGYLKIP